MPSSSFSQSRNALMKNVLAKWSKGGGGPGRYYPGSPSNHPYSPGQAWGTYVVCGCCWAGTTARANSLKQTVPNSSSLYTIFYSVIYNSVILLYSGLSKWYSVQESLEQEFQLRHFSLLIRGPDGFDS